MADDRGPDGSEGEERPDEQTERRDRSCDRP